MDIILDTADIEAIRALDEVINVAGVTTNPTIITRSGRPFEEVRDGLLALLRPEQKAFFQVLAHDAEGIVAEAREIASWREANIYAKIPVTPEGLTAIKRVAAEGIGVLATVIHTPAQGFLAAKNGADYLAPYVNRMENLTDGVGQVLELQAMLEVEGSEAGIIAASIKNVRQVVELACGGVGAVTLPPEVAWAMVNHPATELAVTGFEEAWEATYGRRTLV